jgi:hypothetical protein
VFEKMLVVRLSTQRSPLAPLKKGGNSLKVPLFKGRADSLKEGKELREVMFELARGFGE